MITEEEAETMTEEEWAVRLESVRISDEEKKQTAKLDAMVEKAGYSRLEEAVRADGNCGPDSIAYALCTDEERKTWLNDREQKSMTVRQDVANWMAAHPDKIFDDGSTPSSIPLEFKMNLSQFCTNMKEDRSYWDGPCIPAAAYTYTRGIVVYINDKFMYSAPRTFTPPDSENKTSIVIANFQRRHFCVAVPRNIHEQRLKELKDQMR
jgi:hypothetical protein